MNNILKSVKEQFASYENRIFYMYGVHITLHNQCSMLKEKLKKENKYVKISELENLINNLNKFCKVYSRIINL